MNRLIRVPPGIGDSIWILQKLINAKEKFDFHLSNSLPQRGKQIFDLLPQVASSCEYVPGLGYSTIKATASGNSEYWNEHKDKAFTLECNSHLEAGKRIEDYLPDLPMTYKLPYVTIASDKAHASVLTPVRPDRKYVGLYTSSYNTSKNFGEGFWNANEWFDFAQKISAEDNNIVFVVIGADWDMDLSSMLMTKFLANHIPIPFVNTVGEHLSVVIEILKRLNYFIGFPSGLSIINETLHKKTFMFYPKWLVPLSTAWPEESRIKSNDYIPQIFCTPAEAFTSLMDKTGLQL